MRLLFVVLLALGGCSLSPRTPVLGEAPLPVNYSETTGAVPQGPDGRWWLAFRDPVLDEVIEAGMVDNLDIRAAVLRIDAAQADIVVAGSGGLPSINLRASHIRSRETGEMKTVDGDVKTSMYELSSDWLIDIFGEVRAQVRSARASRDAAIQSVSVARLVLLSDISAAYVDARYYQELGAIGARTVASRERTLELTREMAAQGIASERDVSSALEAVEAVAAEIPGYDAKFRIAANRIATLAGRPAGSVPDGLTRRSKQPAPSFDPDEGVPADLLRNRPDIHRAELEFIASIAELDYSRTQLFPSLTLSGSIAPSYVNTDLKAGDLTKWSFGPTLRLPIFEGGRLRANVRIAASIAERKQIAWRGTVLRAVEEVENALVSFNRQRAAIDTLETRVNAATRTIRLSKAAFEAGMSSRLETLDAERQLFNALSRLALARRDLALNFISLNIAAGRGLPGPGRADQARASQPILGKGVPAHAAPPAL